MTTLADSPIQHVDDGLRGPRAPRDQMMRYRRVMRIAALVLIVWLIPAGCTLQTKAVTQHCANVGDRCQLAEGLQGVCTANDQARCAAPPCLACTPQH